MISVNEIKVVMKEQEERMLRTLQEEKIIERDLVIGRNAIARGAANIITGPRRCGKSVFAFQLAKKEKFGYINFDDERLNFDPGELNKALEAIYSAKGDVDLILFDEIQEAPGWERFVGRLVEDKRVIITGSNARLMSRELATYMTGRHIDHELLPFSFSEFLDYKGFARNAAGTYSTSEKSRIMALLEEYLLKGGFPLGIRIGRSYVADLFSDIIQRDIIQRHRVKMTSKLADLSKYLISNSSSEVSYSKLRNMLGVASKHTIQDWISYMEQAYLLFKTERFSYKLKEAMIAPKKVYAIDTGLATAVSSEIGFARLMETAVAVELQRRSHYFWPPSRQINYWKDHAQREVDFVVREGNKVLELLQVTYASKETEIAGREAENLLAASAELKCKNLTIITWDYEREAGGKNKKISFVPLWKWLLGSGPGGAHR